MRDIKFRGYTQSDKKWVFGTLIEKDGVYYILEQAIGLYEKDNKTFYSGLGGRFRFELHKVEVESIGQFTGLMDKKGAKIYEGDIIKIGWSEPFIYRVVYKPDKGCFVYETDRTDRWFYAHEIYSVVTEIIGNTYAGIIQKGGD